MALSDFKEDLEGEVATILGADFTVDITETKYVPYADDPKITFPNLDTKRMGCKLIDTAVLYIDMRRSTELNLRLKPRTVTKLYSAFVRAMTRCARYYDGHVRGIIGDRVMVLFDQDNCYGAAMDCATLMNGVAKYILNKHFKSDEVTFGIGIDCGRMLASKTGLRKRGSDQQAYRSLVWLGRPANIASKLTDLANKSRETYDVLRVHVAYGDPRNPNDVSAWQWVKESPTKFVGNLGDARYPDRLIKHKNPAYAAHFTNSYTEELRPYTPPILVTERFWNSFCGSNPEDEVVKNRWFKRIGVRVEGYADGIFGGDVVKTALKP